MLKLKKLYLYKLEKFNFKYLFNNNILLLNNNIGYLKIYMPFNYFIKIINNQLSILFNNKTVYTSIFKQILFFFNKFFKFFFFKLKLKGLGYRIKKFTKKLYRFSFGVNHYFYFHVSLDIFVKYYRRNILVFSNNLSKLNDIFSHLLLLKKLDLYERTNTFIISRKIKFFKKRK